MYTRVPSTKGLKMPSSCSSDDVAGTLVLQVGVAVFEPPAVAQTVLVVRVQRVVSAGERDRDAGDGDERSVNESVKLPILRLPATFTVVSMYDVLPPASVAESAGCKRRWPGPRGRTCRARRRRPTSCRGRTR